MAVVLQSGGSHARGGISWATLFLLATGIVCVGLGMIVLAKLPAVAIRAHFASGNWSIAEGTVVDVDLVERADAGGDRHLALVVTYNYVVGSVAYSGKLATYFDTASVYDRRLKAIYTRLNFARVTGSSVPVYHRADDPSVAVLDREFAWSQVLPGLGGGFFLIAFGIACAVGAAGRRGRRMG